MPPKSKKSTRPAKKRKRAQSKSPSDGSGASESERDTSPSPEPSIDKHQAFKEKYGVGTRSNEEILGKT